MNELLPFLTKQQGMSKKVAIRTIRKVDVNGDGVVDRFEFRALLVSLRETLSRNESDFVDVLQHVLLHLFIATILARCL